MNEELLGQARIDKAHTHGHHGTTLARTGKAIRYPLQKSISDKAIVPGSKDNIKQHVLETKHHYGTCQHGNNHTDQTIAQLIEMLPKALRFC
jgi:hypothetical protein